MQFFFAMSNLAASDYIPLARHAERCGYTGVCIPDSICYPQTSATEYPYNSDGSREFLKDKPFLEPFSLAPALAASTQSLRIRTLVYKLPVRNPVLAAKSATSVAVLSDNRFDFGIGLSPWPEDYALGEQPWQARGKRMDEMVEIIRGLSSGEFYRFKGDFYEIMPIQLCPVPTRRLPIMMGGHSGPALRRAALLGDGWLHAGGDHDEMVSMIQQLRTLRNEHGLGDQPFDIHVGSTLAFSVEGLQELAALGVSSVGITFTDAYRAQQLDDAGGTMEKLEGFAESVMRPYRATLRH